MNNITSEIKDNFLLLIINSGEPYNKIDDTTLKEIVNYLARVEKDNSYKCVVLQGGDHFAVGADVKELLLKNKKQLLRDPRKNYWKSIANFSKPIIAAVNGYVLGAGNELVMLADIVVAGKSAVFGQPEINLALIPGAGATQRLVQLLGKPLAMQMILTGRTLSAKEALDNGLVSEVTEDELTKERAEAIATTIGQLSPVAIKAAKNLVVHAFENHLKSGFEKEYKSYCDLVDYGERNEGIKAFLEKRKPKFK